MNYDASELLREFDYLQSSNVDILAWALELSSIPSDSNNDLLSQAMELSEINADTVMDLWSCFCIYVMLCCYVCTQINKIAWDFFTKIATTFVFVQIQSHLYVAPLFTTSLYEWLSKYHVLLWRSLTLLSFLKSVKL